jgi:hypothetical protein
MSVPNQIRDGDWTVATQDGPATWSLPFQSQGDTQTFEYKAKFKQYAANYVPLQNSLAGFNTPPITSHEQITTISTARGTAYLVEESETSDVGCGILEFTRTYASLPVKRTEQSTITYPFQFVSTSGTYSWTTPPPEPTVAELPLVVNANVVYEYSLQMQTVIRAPKVFSVFGTLLYIGTPATGTFFVAEDSAIKLYRGYFYERRTVYVNSATFTT